MGRSSEITRDEIKFTKFVWRIRNKFSNLFLDALKIQLVVKGIINIEDWPEMTQQIRFDFMKDNHFAEIKENEIMQGRINLLTSLDPFVGKYYSPTYIKRNVLMLNDEDIEEIDAENETHNADKQTAEVDDMMVKGKAQADINKMQDTGDKK